MKRILLTALSNVALGAALFAASPVLAQKSADTMRVAINDPFAVLSTYHLPQNEAGTFYNRVYESLIAYDENKQQWVPQLAKSWTRVNPTTLEFELNEKVTFHNGNTFDADDVVGTWSYLIDPKTKLRYKDRYDWVENVEKLGPYKVRLVAKQPTAIDLGLIAYRYTALDIETMKSLDNAEDYGRLTPYGTGFYKVAQLDKNKGIIVERFDNYETNKTYARTPTKRIHGVFIADRQTQIAQLLTGGVDLITNVGQDQANDLKTKPNVAISNMPSGSYIYYALDSGGVSGNKALADIRVRKAIQKSIDRDMIIKHIVPGGEIAERLEVPCFKSTIACKYSVTPEQYDPEGAKKLLAEAGYSNGFDLEFTVFAPVRDIAVAMAGEMRKVGIRVSVESVPITVYRKKQADGQLQSWSLFSLIGKFPDASSALGVWFQGERSDYFNTDPIIMKAVEDGIKELDPVKRDEIYKTAFNRINEMAYIFPLSSMPNVYAHGKDVQILPDLLSATEQYIGDYAFK